MFDNPIYVSVIVPAYQLEAYIAEAIESVLHQTYPYFELVILDDGSSDCTLQIAQAYASQDTRIRLYHHSKNMGAVQTLNDLLNFAQYDWVFYLDGDDRILPYRLERQVAFLQENQGLVLTGALVYYIDSRGKRMGQSSLSPFTSAERVRQEIEADHPIGFPTPTVVIHRPTALKIGGYRQLITAFDVDLYSRLAQAGPVLCQQEVLGEYRIHAKSKSVINVARACKIGRWISASMRARRLGQPEPDLEAYIASENRLPFLGRLSITMKDISAGLYKRAVVAYSSRQYWQSVLFCILCGLSWPPYLWWRFRSRKLFLFS